LHKRLGQAHRKLVGLSTLLLRVAVLVVLMMAVEAVLVDC
jgi:hypothetical protein